MTTATTSSTKPAPIGRFSATSDAFAPWHDARHYIGGALRDPISMRNALDVINPRHGKSMAKVHLGGADDVDAAVKVAAAAQRAWAEWPIRDRAHVLYKLRELMVKNIDELSWLVSHENGKILDRKSTRLNSSHVSESRMPSSA